jgi:hypothetical protein
MTPAGKILFHGKNLSYSDTVVAKQIPVMINQLGLTYSRVQLSLIHHIHLPVYTHDASARSHSPRRDKDNFDVLFMKFGNLVDKRRHARNIKRSIFACQYVTADFYSYFFEAE